MASFLKLHKATLSQLVAQTTSFKLTRYFVKGIQSVSEMDQNLADKRVLVMLHLVIVIQNYTC